jgi:hypothetical protein
MCLQLSSAGTHVAVVHGLDCLLNWGANAVIDQLDLFDQMQRAATAGQKARESLGLVET